MSTAALTRERTVGFDLVTRAALFIGTLLVFWITLEPLKDLSDGTLLAPTQSSDLFNQLLFLTLFLLLGWKLGTMGWRLVLPLAHPAYGAVLAWFLVGCLFAVTPDISLRRLAFCVVVMLIVGVLLVLPPTQRSFESWLGGVALTIVVLCYLTVALFPHLAMHQADAALETNLAGDWRGVYAHKSVTGAMMVVFLLIGAYLTSRRYFILGPTLFVLAGVFLGFTGAKQPQALIAMVFVWSWLAARTKSTGWLFALSLTPLALYLTFTVGSVVFPWAASFNASVMSDPTFTKRFDIWEFALHNFLERPIFGYGFFGFWNTEYVRYTVPSQPGSWAANAAHSHNAYLDIALTTGLPGLLLALWSLLVLPILDFARARRSPENRALALLFFRIWLFVTLFGALETPFFRRDDPIWVAFLLAVFGLRFLASYRVRP